MITKNLRAVLRHEGYTKLATEVMAAQHEHIANFDTVAGAAESIAVKFASNRENERIMTRGLDAYYKLKGLA